MEEHKEILKYSALWEGMRWPARNVGQVGSDE
jgi:hypothetical protein